MTTSVSPDARQLWRLARAPVLIAALVVAAGIVVALMQGTRSSAALDPHSATPDGSRALAELLDAHGVEVDTLYTSSDVRDALLGGAVTVLVTEPELAAEQTLRQITGQAGEAILIAPLTRVDELLPGVRVGPDIEETERDPECEFAAASAAGTATMGGVSYVAEKGVQCYREDEGATLVRVTGDSGFVTLLGTGTPLTNDALDEEGNAALALRLLGQHERLVWYRPTPGEAVGGGDESPLDLLPAGWKFGLVQLCIAVVVIALWRARRLGPVVSEPLPVVVRSAETTEGRALLYRKAHAAEHAAESLRAAARSKIRTPLGLPRDAEPDAVVAAAAARSGRSPHDVHALLYGPAPTGDADLVRIADALDALVSEVLRA